MPINVTSSAFAITLYKEAEAYAIGGATRRTPAYVGQRISVISGGKVKVYVIDGNYNLSLISGSTTATRDSFINFSWESDSGTIGFDIEEGTFIKSITIMIEEPFETEDAFTIGNEYEKDYYMNSDVMLTNEDTIDGPNSYSVTVDRYMESNERILIWFSAYRGQTGKAILKIN